MHKCGNIGRRDIYKQRPEVYAISCIVRGDIARIQTTVRSGDSHRAASRSRENVAAVDPLLRTDERVSDAHRALTLALHTNVSGVRRSEIVIFLEETARL